MSPQPYRILVVDDEPDVEPLVLQRMRRDIRARKYEFVFARNGIEALDILNSDEDNETQMFVTVLYSPTT